MSQHIRSILSTNALARPRQRDWWGFVWRGLVVSRSSKHYNAMGRAVWLFLYLVIHANRRTGTVYRRVRTIAQDIGLSERTVQIWLKILRDKGYILTERTGRSLIIHINKWRPISRSPSRFARPEPGDKRDAN
ncbi:MAG: helix-turn-helix domain-containing protein [Acidobacteria bacterium]|nr:helix-turn-helix domain-containing protein [Acidobacteriota bacterium]